MRVGSGRDNKRKVFNSEIFVLSFYRAPPFTHAALIVRPPAENVHDARKENATRGKESKYLHSQYLELANLQLALITAERKGERVNKSGLCELRDSLPF
jgi:hypothetical protein